MCFISVLLIMSLRLFLFIIIIIVASKIICGVIMQERVIEAIVGIIEVNVT